MTATRIAIVARNPPKIYSGGRYLSWTMAEALAESAADITYITDHHPPCANDFEPSPHHRDIQLLITGDFESDLPQAPFDVILFIPGMDRSPDLYDKTYRRAVRDRARLVFHNFETPNWFNALSPKPRDPELWRHWKEYGSRADVILSMTREADRYARDFYEIGDDGPVFRWLHPGINSRLADMVEKGEREKRIVVFTRFVQAEHKGSNDLHRMLSPDLRGYTLAIVIGNGTIPDDQRQRLERRAGECGVALEIAHALSDRDKFRELRRAELMVFPSLFEGYGLPPVEAQYCDLPCVAFDLPVLREVSGDGLLYCRPGDWDHLRETVAGIVGGSIEPPHNLRQGIAPTAALGCYARRLGDLIEEIAQLPPRELHPLPRPRHGQLGRLGRWVRRRIGRGRAVLPADQH